MRLKDLAKQLANRINQEHYVLHYLNKVAMYFYKKGKEETEKQFVISGVVNCVYVVTYNDDYGRPIFDNCFNKLEISKEYVNEHEYLRMDETTAIKEVEF